MNRQSSCGRPEAADRSLIAIKYLQVAEVAAAGKPDSADRNVAAGNAVLAGVAAADALCCLRLGTRSRAADHGAAVQLLEQVDRKLAQDLHTVLGVKDFAHYGHDFLTSSRLSTVLRAARRLVEATQFALRT